MNSQPIVAHRPGRTVALGHNGNLTNTNELRAELQEQGVRLGSTSDTEVICALIAHHPGTLAEGAVHAMERIRGAFSAVVLSEDTLLAFRDPDGIRPLVLGDLDGSPVVASETPALDIIGATVVRELKPGELLICDSQGHRVEQAVPPRRRETMCVFEHIYFARPDAQMDGQTLHAERERMGERLAARGAGRRRRRDRRARLGHAGRAGLRARVGPAVPRRPDQEPLRRAHVHPARPGAARARRAAQVQPAAARDRGQAARRRRRLDRARLDDAQDRADAARRGRARGAPAHLGAADHLALLLRHRHGQARRADRRRAQPRRDPRAARRRLARLPLARRPAARDRAPRRALLPRLPDGQLPGAGARGGRRGKLRFEREPARA